LEKSDKSRWVRKEFGVSDGGLTIGEGNMKDLRQSIFDMQAKTYQIAKKCPEAAVVAIVIVVIVYFVKRRQKEEQALKNNDKKKNLAEFNLFGLSLVLLRP